MLMSWDPWDQSRPCLQARNWSFQFANTHVLQGERERENMELQKVGQNLTKRWNKASLTS